MEQYGFFWPGKEAARTLAEAPTPKTLHPLPGKSRDWDNAPHLYLEGDNIDALKLLEQSHGGQIALIYIDPPYNTGSRAFVYADDYRAPALGAAQMEEGPRLHARWCSALYASLLLSRRMLAGDGAILINMDENELINLQNICLEVFGEENNLGTIIWDKVNPKGDARGISSRHEYIVAWAKNKEAFFKNRTLRRTKKNAAAMMEKAAGLFRQIDTQYTLDRANRDYGAWLRAQPGLTGGERAYNRIDEAGRVYQAVSMAWPGTKPAPPAYFTPLIHPVTGQPCAVPGRGWRNPPETMAKLQAKGLILYGRDEKTQPRRKYFLADHLTEPLPSVIRHSGDDTALLKALDIPFETPKVVDIVQEHIEAFTRDGETILDFYSGSATTAHAVLKSNAEGGGNRRFILVQAPEDCTKNRDAVRQGFRTICDIGQARIYRAFDTGMQVYEVK